MEKHTTAKNDQDIAFWDAKFESFVPYEVDLMTVKQKYSFLGPIVDDMRGKKVLELGCGNGEMTVYLAKMGGQVFTIDNSENSIKNVKRMAETNNVEIDARVLDALRIQDLHEEFDYVVGKFILHHIEPFHEFVQNLSAVMKQGGVGIFYENSSRNKLLIFMRKHFVGRFGIPKYGDSVEVPFEMKEVEMLKKCFGHVELVILEFVFFQMLGSYIFRSSERLKGFFKKMDRFFYEKIRIFNKYSYHQVVMFNKGDK